MDFSQTPTSHVALLSNEKLLKEAQSIIYKSTDQGDLKLHYFHPEEHTPDKSSPVVIFFHGGKWDQPMASQFIPQALNFVALGAVGIVAEYRTSSLHGSTPLEAISDAKSAILWLRENHQTFGIDPNKITAGGAGSGAHIALCCAMHKKPKGKTTHSFRPDALLLFSSIIDTNPRGIGSELFAKKRDARRSSPNNNIRRKLPPMLFFHGNEDPIVPVASVEKFCQRIRSKHNIARFVPFTRATHSFFNFNVNQHYFVQTLDSAEGFLINLGLLEAPSDTIIR